VSDGGEAMKNNKFVLVLVCTQSETVSDELMVEPLLNYDTLAEVHDLFEVVGLQKVTTVFWSMTGRKKVELFSRNSQLF